ncbi:MAG: CBS domain-containing protein [Gammaproteobacteria bacterium]|nr:CBS domain-containing protein [Gammaproteobacteria bacterium]
MAFTIYGPGIRDEVKLDNLFREPQLEETAAIRAARGVDDQTQQQSQQQPTPRQRLVQSHAGKAYESTRNIRQERELAIRAHQLMSSPVVTLHEQATIVQAWRLFRESRFRYVPVVDGLGKVVGIMSDRALLRYAATSGNVPPYADDSEQSRLIIRPLMSARVVTATPDTEIRQIARLMFERRIGAMPIVDFSGSLVGIITRSDILRTLVNNAPLELWI